MVSGKGVALRLELVKESMKTVDFGTLTGGDYTVRSIVVANRGPKTCQFKLEPAEIRPDVQRYQKRAFPLEVQCIYPNLDVVRMKILLFEKCITWGIELA